MKINSIFNLINKFNNQILAVLVLAVVLLIIINLISQVRISSIRKKYNDLVEGKEGLDLEEMLFSIKADLSSVGEKFVSIDTDIKKINNDLIKTLQKVGMIRYNALADLGSNQSYSLALLDKDNNGLVLTSLYGRDFTASYLKPITDGKSEYKLSKEEDEALEEAMKG